MTLYNGAMKTEKSLAVAESCTGGLVSSLITDVSGASDYFKMGVITYSNASKEKVKDEKRVVLSLHKALAPIKTAVLPLLRNRPEIVELAKNITKDLEKKFRAVYDDTASIGRLYRRQDEVGTPYCITVDVDSLSDRKVTVRDRDTMAQDRIEVSRVKEFLVEKLG